MYADMRTRTDTAPKFLNLTRIRWPIGAIASIDHRVSGVLPLIALPLLAIALEKSLRSSADFSALGACWFDTPWGASSLVVVVWALSHHVLAGVRHLLMDIGIGSGLHTARRSAVAVIAAGVLVAIITAIGALL